MRMVMVSVCVCVVHRRRRCAAAAAAAAAVFPSLSYLLTSSDCRCSFSLMCFVVVTQTAATRDDQQWWWLVSFAPTGNLRLCLLASSQLEPLRIWWPRNDDGNACFG